MKIMRVSLVMAFMLGALLVEAKICDDCRPKTNKPASAKPIKAYPLTTCLVSGKLLDKNKIDYTHKDQQVIFCSKSCKREFLKNPAPFLAKLEVKKSEKTVTNQVEDFNCPDQIRAF